MRKAFLSVKALRLQSAVAQHLDHLRISLTLLAEDELSLFVIILILSPPSVFAALKSVSLADVLYRASHFSRRVRGSTASSHHAGNGQANLSFVLGHVGCSRARVDTSEVAPGGVCVILGWEVCLEEFLLIRCFKVG